MGIETSKNELTLSISFDSRYFKETEIEYIVPKSASMQVLFYEAKQKLINQDETTDIKMHIGDTLIDSSCNQTFKALEVKPFAKVKVGVRLDTVKLQVVIQRERSLITNVLIQKKKSISDLKKKLLKDSYSCDSMMLLKNTLVPDDLLIKDLNLKEQEKLQLMVTKNNQFLALWRLKFPGLNIEGFCMNSNCKAYRQTVNISKGFGDFEILNEINNELNCPDCQNIISKTVGSGLSWCRYNAVYYNEYQQKISVAGSAFQYIDIPKEWKSPYIEVTSLYSNNN